MVRTKSFSDATAQERFDQARRTEALMCAGASDAERWRDPSAYDEAWAARGATLAKMVARGERVFEFGAGKSAVASALAVGCTYIASDLQPLSPGVVQFDLNAPALNPIHGADVALLSGVLEYVHDVPRAAAFFAQNFRTVICSYAEATDLGSETIAKRRYSGWFHDFSAQALAALFKSAGFEMTTSETWRDQVLFRFGKQCEAQV